MVVPGVESHVKHAGHFLGGGGERGRCGKTAPLRIGSIQRAQVYEDGGLVALWVHWGASIDYLP
jgi:hypothetical protein